MFSLFHFGYLLFGDFNLLVPHGLRNMGHRITPCATRGRAMRILVDPRDRPADRRRRGLAIHQYQPWRSPNLPARSYHWSIILGLVFLSAKAYITRR